MTPRQARNPARAIELDDPHPDHICPGCGRLIHPDSRIDYRCPWNSDYLNARKFRRAYIREHTAAVVS